MDREEHIQKHKDLHRSLDELLADFITHTGELPSKSSIFELVEWSFEQSINPTELEED